MGTDHPPEDARDRGRGLAVLAVALLPALLAVLLVPGFATQDGSAHIYNAHILRESLRPGSPLRATYEVRWQPLPNWAGHLLTMGLLQLGGPDTVERALLGVTLVGVAGAIVFLRRQVAGWTGMTAAALAATLLALNITWLSGFHSFLLGTAAFALTLGFWWRGRDDLRPARLVGLAILLVLGYFCHLISVGLTVVGLGVLAVATPCPGRRTRVIRTAACLVPLVPLLNQYRRLMRHGGAIQPLWMELKDPFSLASWRAQVGWVDPLSLAGKLSPPFLGTSVPAFALLAPVFLFELAVLAFAWSAIARRGNEPTAPSPRRGWAWLAAVLLLAGLVGPDTLGPSHGNYLALRCCLLGLICLMPLLDLRADTSAGRVGLGLLAIAVAVQSAYVWDHARSSARLVAEFERARPIVGTGQRVGTLLLDLRQRFRANPLLHVDDRLGVGTSNVIWNNYETAFYYFPVQVRPDVPHPPPLAFELVSILDDPEARPRRAAAWRDLLEKHADAIDVLVVRGQDPDGLDPITARYFLREWSEGAMSVWRRRANRPPR